MDYPVFFDFRNSINLFGLNDEFKFLSDLYMHKKLPKVIMLSGNKGIGKSTLTNHFVNSIFDKQNYDIKNLSIFAKSQIYSQFKENIFSNIIYINGFDFKSIKIEDIRNLKTKINQSSILNKERFIVLDDIELFNLNSLNALLKIIEEPSDTNHFILINNQSKELLDTIKSRCLEIKINIKEKQRIEIINKLVNHYKLDLVLDKKNIRLSPGNFIKFNYILKENDISINGDFLESLSILLNLYKKNKDIIFINIIYFIAEFYLKNLKDKKILQNERLFEVYDFILENVNKFVIYNMSQNSLINLISNKLHNE